MTRSHNIRLILLQATIFAAMTLTGCGGGGGGGQTGQVTGTVIDAVSSLPVNTALVSIGGNHVTTTNGTFSLPGVAPGSYTLTASATGYTTRNIPISVVPGVNALANIKMYSSATTGSIIGRVVKASDGQPLTTAIATVGFDSVTCEVDGRFEIPGVPEGSATLVLAALGYTARSINVNVTRGIATDVGSQPLSVDTGGDVPGGPRTIDGTITLQGQSDHSGVQVTLIGSGISYPATLTGSNGTYAIWAPAGSYTLQAEKSGYATGTQSVTIHTEPDQIQHVNLTLTPL